MYASRRCTKTQKTNRHNTVKSPNGVSMKRHSFHSFISWMILAGLIIFFTGCSGCIHSSSPPGPAIEPTGTVRGMPDQAPGVTPAATTPISPFLTETSPGASTRSTGSLTIWSTPPACSVYIDGMYAGDTPPGRESFTQSITSGPHTVKITKIGYEDYTQDVIIPLGKSVIVTAALPEKTFPDYTLNPTSTVTEPYS